MSGVALSATHLLPSGALWSPKSVLVGSFKRIKGGSQASGLAPSVSHLRGARVAPQQSPILRTGVDKIDQLSLIASGSFRSRRVLRSNAECSVDIVAVHDEIWPHLDAGKAENLGVWGRAPRIEKTARRFGAPFYSVLDPMVAAIMLQSTVLRRRRRAFDSREPGAVVRCCRSRSSGRCRCGPAVGCHSRSSTRLRI